ncbi:hypothetical protein [Streptomyces sp. SID4982]|uniref:hypothetical protein n=1 Tax=Streptomyces sp. SID4982 TaxID=2690291 RepID=UPI00136A3819|nr:hypothetical protein [Streptomyces sp. SID4982]MYS15063.1 hypothetical protein [Streptomyces sp. SID4982]
MTDLQPFERLAGLCARFDTSARLDEWDWSAIFEYGEGSVPTPDEIAEITDLWVISPEGYASLDVALICRLRDGRWASCVAWADTSGFGCQQGVDWRINSTREAAISQGLDKESRTHLGLALPGEENNR